jgi:hypothetical protein
MEPTPQARTAVKAHKSAIPAQSPLKAFKQRSKNHTLLSNGKRDWIPNSRTRWTSYIKAEKALEVLQAAAHAHTIGTPLNYQADIHFECGQLNELYTPQEAIGAWTKAMGQYLAKKGVQSTFVSFREHAAGTGEHVHILLHVPPEHRKDFEKLARTSWLRIAHMSPDNRAVIKMQKLGPRDYPLRHSTEKQSTYFNCLAGSLRYRMKGINPDQALPRITGSNRPVAELLGIEPEDNEPIYGRRVSHSQNILKAARDSYAAVMGNEPSEALIELLKRFPKLPFEAITAGNQQSNGDTIEPIAPICHFKAHTGTIPAKPMLDSQIKLMRLKSVLRGLKPLPL